MIRRPPTSPLFHSTTLILLRQVSRRCKLGELYMKNCTSVIYGPIQLNPANALKGEIENTAARFKAFPIKLGLVKNENVGKGLCKGNQPNPGGRVKIKKKKYHS